MTPRAVQASDGAKANIVDKTGLRVIQFPANVSIGRLTVLESPHTFFDRHLAGKPYGDCRGEIKVPRNLSLYLIANENVADNYQCFSKMAADTFVAAYFSRTTCGDKQMEAINHLSGLQYLTLDGTEITDAGLAKLTDLKNLEFLDLSHTDINGDGLARLIEGGGLQKLEWLDLGSNRLNKRVLSALAKLPRLVRLRIGHAGLTDNDIKALGAIKGLSMLYLFDNAALTDKGLSGLLASKYLKFLDARGTGITARGVLGLASLPLSSIRLNENACSSADKIKLEKTFGRLNLQTDSRAKAMPMEVFAPLH